MPESPQDRGSAATGDLTECLARAARLVDAARLEVAMHPDDVTDEVRRRIEAVPLTTLRESSFIVPGTAYLIHPGAILGDLYGD